MAINQKYVVSLDQGTTSSRTIVYDLVGNEVKQSSESLPVSFPKDGWVEQNPIDIWKTQLNTLKLATTNIELAKVVSLGLTNQRETIICWDRATGNPLAPAIVWQCRRSGEICQRLKSQGLEPLIKRKTGLLLDPYFSATKIMWLLENISGLKEKTDRKEAIFGTVDTWIIYNLTKAKTVQFVTEPSNASRTMLFSLESLDWDQELLDIFGLDRDNLAEIRPSAGQFGRTDCLGQDLPITAVLGDQQASLFGHSCFEQNSLKCTFGTGAFLLVNKGTELPRSDSGLLSTVAWTIGNKLETGKTTFALEGSIFIAGALIQWLRDKLQIISDARESEKLARDVSSNGGVVVVPAFVGLGAPYWDSDARAAILNLTRDSNRSHIVRASLEAVAHQVADLLELTELEQVKSISIDGGMSANVLFCEILAGLSQREIVVAKSKETTAFGVGRLALIEANAMDENKQIPQSPMKTLENKTYKPSMSISEMRMYRKQWKDAVNRVRT